MVEEVAPPPAAQGRQTFATEAGLLTFLGGLGLDHLARLSLSMLAPRLDAVLPEARAVRARRRLVEVLNQEGLDRFLAEARPGPKLAELLPALAWAFVDSERAAAAEALAELPARLALPGDGRAHAVHRLLIESRSRFPASVAARPSRALSVDTLQADESLPGFRLREARCSELPAGEQAGFILPEATLTFSPAAARTDCSCRARFCVHGLAAIDTLLLRLQRPLDKSFAALLDDLVRPGWERTLRALEKAVQDGAGEAAPVEISWGLAVHEADGGLGPRGALVSAYVHRRKKAGQRSAPVRVGPRKLMQDHGGQLSPADARVAALLPEGLAPASRALLFELADHPRVHLEDEPDQPVRVERAKVGLVAEDRGGVVLVTAGLDGSSLPAEALERLRRAGPDDALFEWDEASRRLTVLDVSPQLRALLVVLAKQGNTFPPESRAALIEQLSKLSTRVPIALPRSVMGEAVAPLETMVLRLEARPGGAVRLELRVRPLHDSPTFVPGEGVRDVHVRRGEKAFHAVRDFARERSAADALQALLPLEAADADEARFSFLFSSAQDGLALLAAAQALSPRPDVEWVGTPLRLFGTRGPGALKVHVGRRQAWYGLLGGLSVEGERIELARLLDAARRKDRFVEVSASGYVELEAALRLHLERLADHAHEARQGLAVGPSAAMLVAALSAAGAQVEADASWQQLSERVAAAGELQPEVPKELRAGLRGYQLEGFRWMSRLAAWGAGGILADDMGLGKTVQALALLQSRAPLGPALVLAPTSVAFNWLEEARRFTPKLRAVLLAEATDRDGTLEALGPGDVLILSHGLLTRHAARLAMVRFATLVFDEAQTLKNALTHRFRAARDLQGDFRIALSGTPLENHLGELWSLFAVVFPALLGSWEAFRQRYASPIEKKEDPAAAPSLARVLQPFLLRRTKAEVESQLPPRTDVRVPVLLSAGEFALYEDARLAALSDLESRKTSLQQNERRIQALAAITRLRLLACHPRLGDRTSTLPSAKLARFLELVEELRAEGHRALVFSQFTSHLALAAEALDARGIAYESLDGSTPQATRAARVRAFQEGTAPLFLISVKAGGFGLNLTAASSVIHLDPWWNPAVEDQASDRAHRIGQDKPVTVYRLVSLGTIEEEMLALHAHKRALVAGVLEGKELAGKLTTRELIGLFESRAKSTIG